MKLTNRQQEIIRIVAAQESAAISKIKELLYDEVSIPTLNRDIAKLVKTDSLQKTGAGRAISYVITPYYRIFAPINTDHYFRLELDEREALTTFNYELIDSLTSVEIFTAKELKFL